MTRRSVCPCIQAGQAAKAFVLALISHGGSCGQEQLPKSSTADFDFELLCFVRSFATAASYCTGRRPGLQQAQLRSEHLPGLSGALLELCSVVTDAALMLFMRAYIPRSLQASCLLCRPHGSSRVQGSGQGFMQTLRHHANVASERHLSIFIVVSPLWLEFWLSNC